MSTAIVPLTTQDPTLERVAMAAVIGLPLINLTTCHIYYTATYAAPADLSTLNAYSTYSARLAKAGACMVRFGVCLRTWTVEVVFIEAAKIANEGMGD